MFTSAKNLKTILCAKNKSKLTPNSNPGVYELKCFCGGVYIGETMKKILIRAIEFRQSSMKGRCDKSGVTEHSKDCHGQFNWLHPKTVAITNNFHQRKIRESLEINLLQTKVEQEVEKSILNRDNGNRVNTSSWKPFFSKLLKR